MNELQFNTLSLLFSKRIQLSENQSPGTVYLSGKLNWLVFQFCRLPVTWRAFISLQNQNSHRTLGHSTIRSLAILSIHKKFSQTTVQKRFALFLFQLSENVGVKRVLARQSAIINHVWGWCASSAQTRN